MPKETDKIQRPYGEPLWGKFWYSITQRRELDKIGHDRTFAKIGEDIKEYTEMQDAEMEFEEPNYIPEYDDISYLGRGYYYGRIVA